MKLDGALSSTYDIARVIDPDEVRDNPGTCDADAGLLVVEEREDGVEELSLLQEHCAVARCARGDVDAHKEGGVEKGC